MDSPITELHLGTKPYKALKSLGVNTVGEFLSINLDRINEIFGMGSRTRQLLETNRRDILALIGKDDERTSGIPHSSVLQPWSRVLNQLSVRTKNGLSRLSIETPEEFLTLTRTRFLNVRGLGETCWKEISKFQKQLSPFYGSHNLSDVISINESREAETMSDSELIGIVRGDLGARCYIIDDLYVKSFGQLCRLSHEEVTSLDHIGQVTWKKLQTAIQKAKLLASNRYKPDIANITIYIFPLYDGPGIGCQEIPDEYFPDTPREDIPLASRIHSVLSHLNISTLGELLMTSSQILLKQKNFGESSLNKLRKSIRNYLDYCNNCNDIPIDMQHSFADFLAHLCNFSNQPSKHTDILIARICGESGCHRTLKDLGYEYGFTRERVRQIIKSTFEKIENNPQSQCAMNHFQNIVLNILSDFRGVIGLSEMGLAISKEFDWPIPIPPDSLSEFYKYVSISQKITVQDKNIVCQHRCRECRFVREHLMEMISKEPTEKISLEALTYEGHLCNPTPDRGCPANKHLEFSKAFLYELCNKCSFKFDKYYIYSENAWALQHGGLNRKVDAILDMLGVAANPETVSNELSNRSPVRFAPKKIHGALINCENSYVWGRGEFVHKNHIPNPISILQPLNDILSLKLKDIPFVALHGIFNEFRITFESAGIPNEYALSTIVKIYLEDFHVDRYRYVYEEKPTSATSIDSHIEQWVLEQEDVAKHSDLEDWMLNTVGAKQSVLQIALGRLSSIIPVKKGYVMHIDNLDINKEKLIPLHQWIGNALSHNVQIGVHKLYAEQKLTCFQLGIHSKNMLYAILRYFYSDKYDFPRFPHICRIGSDVANSLNEALSNFAKEEHRVVSIDECTQHFEVLGYPPLQIRARIPSISELPLYYPGCIIHEEIIEWSNQKEEQLYITLVNAYEKRLQLGHYTGDLEEMFGLYEDKLPVLGNDMSWTGDLLASLSIRLKDVVMIGNAKRAYSIISNTESIKSLGNLICLVVKKYFGGGCNREQLNQWMIENGVVRKQVTPQMFTAPSGLVMTEYECLWEGDCKDE